MNTSENPPIPFNDFTREPEELIAKELEAVESVLRSGWWVLGKEVELFESKWANYCSTLSAVGVANGLDAIEIGLRSLGVGPGDEVITTSLTAFATCLAILRTGATPVFADIDPETGCIEQQSIHRCINSSTKAILVVHLYGRAVDMENIINLTSNLGIFLVEDCAQSHGAKYNGKPVGSIGDFGAWSFYPTKNLGAVGDAGAITSNNQELILKAKMLRNYGQSDRYYHPIIGMNSRLDELQASLLNVRLEYLNLWTNRRRSIAKRYWAEISNPEIKLLQQPTEDENHVHHLFVIYTKKRRDLQNQLSKMNISSLIHYPIACHLQSALKEAKLDPNGLNNTKDHCENCLSLPIQPYLTDLELDRIIDVCNNQL